MEQYLRHTDSSAYNSLVSGEGVDELKSAHTSRERRNFLFQRQLTTLEEVTSLCRRAWDKEALFEALVHLTEPETGPRGGLSNRSIHIKSVAQLRDLLASNSGSSPTSISSREEVATLLKDVAFLANLRLAFEERLMDLLNGVYIVKGDLEINEYAQFVDTVSYEITRQPLTVALSEDIQQRVGLHAAINDLYKLRNRWKKLLTADRPVDVDNDFDKGSRHEILSFAGYHNFESVFRLVPDLLMKATRALALVKSIWSTSDRRFRERQHRLENFNKTLDGVREKYSETQLECEELEETIQELDEKLSSLAEAGSRFDQLKHEYDTAMTAVAVGEVEMYELNKINQADLERWKTAPEDSPTAVAAYEKYVSSRRDLSRKRSQINLDRYKSRLLRDSLQMVVDVKCGTIRASSAVTEDREDAAEKLGKFRKELESLKAESDALEEGINRMVRHSNQQTSKPFTRRSSVNFKQSLDLELESESEQGTVYHVESGLLESLSGGGGGESRVNTGAQRETQVVPFESQSASKTYEKEDSNDQQEWQQQQNSPGAEEEMPSRMEDDSRQPQTHGSKIPRAQKQRNASEPRKARQAASGKAHQCAKGHGKGSTHTPRRVGRH